MPSCTFNLFQIHFLPPWTHLLGQFHLKIVCLNVEASSTPRDPAFFQASLIKSSLNKQNSLEFPSYYTKEILQRSSCCLVNAEVKKWGEEMEYYYYNLELKKWDEGEKWSSTTCFLVGSHCPEPGASLFLAALTLESGAVTRTHRSFLTTTPRKIR